VIVKTSLVGGLTTVISKSIPKASHNPMSQPQIMGGLHGSQQWESAGKRAGMKDQDEPSLGKEGSLGGARTPFKPALGAASPGKAQPCTKQRRR
jgi:hypothetical protein